MLPKEKKPAEPSAGAAQEEGFKERRNQKKNSLGEPSAGAAQEEKPEEKPAGWTVSRRSPRKEPGRKTRWVGGELAQPKKRNQKKNPLGVRSAGAAQERGFQQRTNPPSGKLTWLPKEKKPAER